MLTHERETHHLPAAPPNNNPNGEHRAIELDETARQVILESPNAQQLLHRPPGEVPERVTTRPAEAE